ncbi:hypothetical protein [Calidithermus timidus]|jgi:RNA polymerase primary sigma factor|uniref:hypothetical protein n=1 Tax=Calidithermus timidus TaxID=307124 RepID=UPI00039D81E8|nr:hypothetical protein [Calidithermus timidus]
MSASRPQREANGSHELLTRPEDAIAVEQFEEVLEKAHLGLRPEEASTLDRFQADLDALAQSLKARVVA